MFGLFPLLICILAAILLKWLLELGFRMAGRPADAICGVLLAAVGFSPLVMFARKIIQIRQDG